MNKIKRDKIAGAIYGFAIGDAMGATTEFMSDKQIKSTFGKVTDIIGGGWLKLSLLQVAMSTETIINKLMHLTRTLDMAVKIDFEAFLRVRCKFLHLRNLKRYLDR